jgi:hypothetical protein
LQIVELTARTTSMNLRHGVPIQFICEQLDKIGGQYLFSLPTNIARVLRNYINTGNNEVPVVTSSPSIPPPELGPILEKCPKCNHRSYRKTGQACGICERPECAFSGCS